MQRSCSDVNSPYKRKCWTNSGGPLVNSLLWGLSVPGHWLYDLKTWNKSKKEEGRKVWFSGVGRIVLLWIPSLEEEDSGKVWLIGYRRSWLTGSKNGNAKLMKENFRVNPWIILYIFAYSRVLITHLNWLLSRCREWWRGAAGEGRAGQSCLTTGEQYLK